MIKTNQILSVRRSRSIEKVFLSTSSERFFYFPRQKKLKLSGSKITGTETFARSQEYAK